MFTNVAQIQLSGIFLTSSMLMLYLLLPNQDTALIKSTTFQAAIHLFKISNAGTKTMRGNCSNVTIKTPKQRYWRRFVVFIVNFEQISHIVLFLLFTLNK